MVNEMGLIQTVLILIVVLLLVAGLLALANWAGRALGLDAQIMRILNVAVVVVVVIVLVLWLLSLFGVLGGFHDIPIHSLRN